MKIKANTPGDINSGHGWVWPLWGGAKARCGGPGACEQCNADLAALEAERES